MPPIPLLLSAGEASGDMYAARLASALMQRLDVAIFGMGGPQMRAAGVEIITDYSEVSVVGITEVLKRLPRSFAPCVILSKKQVVESPRSPSSRIFPAFTCAWRASSVLKAFGTSIIFAHNSGPGALGV